MAHKTASRPTQFSLRWMFGMTTLFGVVFAILAALGVSPLDALVGFGVIGGVVAAVAGVVELIARALGYRSAAW